MTNLKNPPLLKHKIILLLIIVPLLAGLDLGVKAMVKQHLENKMDVVVIPGFWSLHYTENDDMGFSLLRFLDNVLYGTNKFILIVILQAAGVVVAAGVYFFFNRWKYCLPLLLIISGGLGNLADRIIRGYVVDYVMWYIGSFVWPIFNLADVYGVTGACLMLFILLFFSKTPGQEPGALNKGKPGKP